ncbi:sensor histidine kinase [Novosphingobium sp. JCM 18896]|uniref:sensor histidine kinase n=1 Tax=Novosphingobium sp. JCM 18896 TaxID=2989731 RepID=UPI002221FB75|nr:HAMP domain-containing sensor histidine kinase [Novosphingobium sp. JCM 18896]MCW1432251.1 HAMP domain-containing histidine kinase [Novosphingobium sp. JCM 18896]
MWRWLAEIRRSAVFRISLINIVLLVLAFASAFTAAWLSTRNSVEQAARDRIIIETDALLAELNDEGVRGAAAAVAWRSRRQGSLHYLIDKPGQPPIGDLVSAPRQAGWHRLRMRHGLHAGIPVSNREDTHVVLLQVVIRDCRYGGEGTRIAVGEDLTATEAVREALFDAMLPIGGSALALGVLLIVAGSNRTLRRMNDIMRVVRAAETGDFTARIRAAKAPRDDVDSLGVAVNGMLDRIDVLMATVERVSAEIAHDLRTPLTQVRHAVQAARNAADDGRRTAALEAAEEGVARALRLFDEMLKLAEIDSGQMRADFVSVDLGVVLSRVIDAYRAEIEASGRSLGFECDQSCQVRGNADLLTQAIANLVENALKHSRDGAVIQVKASYSHPWIVIAVEDDGPGVDPADVARILRPFGRLDSARSTPGTGLGLAITKSVAALHGGRVRVVHRAPGLAVILELPCQPAMHLSGV